MHQLMILDTNGNILGACTGSDYLPDVKEIYPGKNYTGVEVPYNMDMLLNYRNYCYRNGEFFKREPVPYQITKIHIGPDGHTTLFVPKGTVAVVEKVEYLIDDGCIEYSNPNEGMHQILLRLEGYNDTPVYVEVMTE